MKKFLAILLTVLLCLLTLPVSVAADEWTEITSIDQVASNTSGNYRLTDDITMSGTKNLNYADTEIVIDLNGHNLIGGSTYMFRLEGSHLKILIIHSG